MIRFDIVTVFPDILESYCSASIIGRARKQGLVDIRIHNLRDWTTDKHRTVDDRVFGGGAGMLMKIEPLYKAITDLKKSAIEKGYTPKVIATVASGNLFTQEKAQSIAFQDDYAYIIICGHYEGFDARVYEWVDEQLAIGPYVLTGGELPSLIMIDAVTRLIPGVLGNENSAAEETTFTLHNGSLEVLGEHPQYTMPATFTFTDENGHVQERVVPEILRSGNHKKIAEENKSQRKKKTIFSL